MRDAKAYVVSGSADRPVAGALPSLLLVLALLSAPLFGGQFYMQANAARYLIYFAPLAVLLIRTPGRIAPPIDKRKGMYYAILILVLLACVHGAGGTGARYLFLMSGAFILVIFRFKVETRFIDLLFLLLLSMQIAVAGQNGFSLQDFNPLSSTQAGETNTLPFVIGLFPGFYFAKRRFGIGMVALLAAFVGGKRVVMLAEMVGLCSLGLSVGLRTALGKTRLTAIIIKAGMVVVLAVVAMMGLYAEIVYKFLSNFLLIDEAVFTAGRSVGQEYAFRVWSEQSESHWLLGNGLGFADSIAAYAWHSDAFLVHDDYLRLALDMGLLFGPVVVIFYYILLSPSDLGPFYIPLLAVYWLTDNTMIYSFVHLGLVLLLKAGSEGFPEQRYIRRPNIPRAWRTRLPSAHRILGSGSV